MWKLDDSRPIYPQLKEILLRDIITGKYRSFAKTNAAPLKRNGRDCSPGFCSVPIAVTNSTLPPARVLRESRITMFAPVTRATEEPAAHTISVKILCGI